MPENPKDGFPEASYADLKKLLGEVIYNAPGLKQETAAKFLLTLGEKHGEKAVWDFLKRHEKYRQNEETQLQTGKAQPRFVLSNSEKRVLSATSINYDYLNDKKLTRRDWWLVAGAGFAAAMTTGRLSKVDDEPDQRHPMTTTALLSLPLLASVMSVIMAIGAPTGRKKQDAREAFDDFMWDLERTLRGAARELAKSDKRLPGL